MPETTNENRCAAVAAGDGNAENTATRRAEVVKAIEDHLPAIVRNGTLVRRKEPGRSPCWTIRFRNVGPAGVERAHRRITLGSDIEMVSLAKQLIAVRNRMRAEKRAVDDSQAEKARRLTAMVREAVDRAGGSRRQRRETRKAFREYCDAVPQPSVDEFFRTQGPLDRSRQGPGRPRKRSPIETILNKPVLTLRFVPH